VTKKNLQSLRKYFEKFFRVQTRRRAEFFEVLNSCLPFMAPELRLRKSTCDPFL